MSDRYEAVIGLEIHAQISTKSKLFCSCSSDAFNQRPNLNTCPVCMGFPGQLPVINKEALKKGIRAALALHCDIPASSKFDRKNYFYPDLPKGFQISQFDEPVSKNGWLEIELDEKEIKKIRITRLHLEDDAGKLTHLEEGTLCDYNRSGIALMEIVSEPDIRNAHEAVAYARAIQMILRYVGSSDADMEKGMMRFDASVSIREKNSPKLNPRAEIKNLNSFKALEEAINYEIEQQIFLAEEGKPLTGDITVGWNDAHKKTYFLRDKEGADDYRYFPEPDLPPLTITSDFIDQLKAEIPEMPKEKVIRYQDAYKLSEAEAKLIVSDLKFAHYFEATTSLCQDPKKAATFLTSIVMGHLNRDGKEIDQIKVTPIKLAKIIELVNNGAISMNIAKNDVFEAVYTDDQDPENFVKTKGLVQMNDQATLETICKKIIEENPQSVQDFKNGKKAAMQFLVGKVMKETKGQANAQVLQETFQKLLSV